MEGCVEEEVDDEMKRGRRDLGERRRRKEEEWKTESEEERKEEKKSGRIRVWEDRGGCRRRCGEREFRLFLRNMNLNAVRHRNDVGGGLVDGWRWGGGWEGSWGLLRVPRGLHEGSCLSSVLLGEGSWETPLLGRDPVHDRCCDQ